MHYIHRLAVKSLIDKACLETVDDTSEELQNFCIIMEHILCHRLKSRLFITFVILSLSS